MVTGKISKRVVADRIAWVEATLADIRALPLEDDEAFFSDRRNVWTAESCLRRSLEALLDLGRHTLAKGFGQGVSEYKEIALRLQEQAVLPDEEADLLRVLAGYRNRLVHFYHEVSEEELYQMSVHQLDDLERILEAYKRWFSDHPELLEDVL